MNIDLSSIRNTNPNKSSGSTGSSLESRIDALKKKMADLFKELKELGQNPGEDSNEKAELIQKQIELLQAQIQQLEALKLQQDKAEAKAQAEKGALTESAAVSNDTTDSKLGGRIDNYS